MNYLYPKRACRLKTSLENGLPQFIFYNYIPTNIKDATLIDIERET